MTTKTVTKPVISARTISRFRTALRSAAEVGTSVTVTREGSTLLTTSQRSSVHTYRCAVRVPGVMYGPDVPSVFSAADARNKAESADA